MKKALTDYKRAAQVNARDPDLRKKLTQCEKEVKRIRFEEAVATPVSLTQIREIPYRQADYLVSIQRDMC